MRKHAGRWTCGAHALLLALAISIPAIAQGNSAQEPARATDSAQSAPSSQYAPGQVATIEGTVMKRDGDTMIVRTINGSTAKVDITSGTKFRERKSNPFRHARNYAAAQLLTGLDVQVKGRGTSNGSLAAEEIRFTSDDLRIAALMDTRVSPLESQLSQQEQNSMRLSGQVSELSAVSNAARGGAKAAQETADQAMESAKNANSSAENAKASAENAKEGVRATNDRITSLDDFDIRSTTTVTFKVGSAVLSPEAKEALNKLAEEAKNDKGFVVEVAGFASSDGNAEYNKVLSQRRADAVIRYLAENHAIPMRRFITPFGYGTLQPVADNHTREGRIQNRRVEVRILTSKGYSQVLGTTAASH